MEEFWTANRLITTIMLLLHAARSIARMVLAPTFVARVRDGFSSSGVFLAKLSPSNGGAHLLKSNLKVYISYDLAQACALHRCTAKREWAAPMPSVPKMIVLPL